jgi:hypothetical protein
VEVLALALVMEMVTPGLWVRRSMVGWLGEAELEETEKEVQTNWPLA